MLARGELSWKDSCGKKMILSMCHAHQNHPTFKSKSQLNPILSCLPDAGKLAITSEFPKRDT